ncbi:hypothetical protein LTR78_002383 [Recurvomyces mirabilis]|uniref:catechol O-methyltransferase n=1 Tax=Recurvomyces mirabilis TaxID=574656 RepID=A0AAE1C493_9PEZI|nr:hypothetical protein LTR78_002383 [Recurvomyces mirabilis]KAK5157312.1 hypothetical protein LTS14_004077 [Recurvomyces mirabilis]
MPEFDKSKAYSQQEKVFFDDGREVELLHYVYGKDNLEEIRGSPEKVLAAIDEFGRTKKYLMNVGEDKGKIVELGGYIGYSCLLFGNAVRKAGGKRYYSLERNPEFGAVISSLADLAGLSDVVKVIIGSSDASLKRLHDNGTLKHIDLMFLDHYKPAYKTDLKLCEELKLISPGSVLAADNVISPGNPSYLEYVRASPQQKKEWTQQANGQGAPDVRFQDKTVQQYANRGESTALNASLGTPGLVYDSKLVHSFEPTGDPDGIEISRCTGEE